MDTSKFYEVFQPESCKEMVNIIGCGAVGSTIAELLVRMGLTKFTLYDFDCVMPHNIANQMFRQKDIGKPKTEALAEILREINPEVTIVEKEKYESEMLRGYVFLAVDKISVRKKIIQDNMMNPYVKAVFDTRISLYDAQGYAARWDKHKEKQNLLNSMNFTDEEAAANTPVSACNLELGIAPTVRLICGCVVMDFMNLLLKNENFKTIILLQNVYNMMFESF